MPQLCGGFAVTKSTCNDGCVCVCCDHTVRCVQLQAKFEGLKKQQADDRKKLEDKRRILDEQVASFEQKKLHTMTSSQSALSGPQKKKK